MAHQAKTLWLNFPIFSFVTTKILLQIKNYKKKWGYPNSFSSGGHFEILSQFCMKYIEKMVFYPTKNSITKIKLGQILRYSQAIRKTN